MMRWTREHMQFDTGNFNDANGGKIKEIELELMRLTYKMEVKN